MKKLLAVACLLILASAPPLAARQSKDDKSEGLPPVLKDAFKTVEVPGGKGSWALQVVTRGGLTGAGRGDLTVTSDGRVTCGAQATPCAFRRSETALASLSQAVAAAKPSKWRGGLGACNDCYVSMLVLQRREGSGTVKNYAVYWDDTTAAAVPAEVKEILRGLAALAFVPARAL